MSDAALESLDRRHAAETEAAPSWLQRVRGDAFAAFRERGWPSRREEAWKNTRLDGLRTAEFVASESELDEDSLRGLLRPYLLFEPSVTRLTFVNGRFAPELSAQPVLPSGVEVRPLGAALGSPDEALKRHFGARARYQGDGPRALNTAFLADGAWIRLQPGAYLDHPVHLVFLSVAPDGRPQASHPRVLVEAGRQSHATIVETYAGAGAGSLTNATTELLLDDDAAIEHYRAQEEDRGAWHLGRLEARLGRGSRFQSHNLSLGAAVARTEIRTTFTQPGGDCQLNGLYVVSGSQRVDNQIEVDHAVPHCTSSQNYRGVLDGDARGAFSGRILVRPDAQGTNAAQSNKNLLLSPTAHADAVPQLEIHADDVKCAHGVTIGQLEEESIFYLRSRGIGLDEARAMLTQAFAGAVTEHVRVAALRCRLDRMLAERLGAGALPIETHAVPEMESVA